MQCQSPIEKRRKDGSPFTHRCDQCIACRVTRTQEIAFRLMLEAKFTADLSLFVTLTYDEKSIPRTQSGLPTARRRDIRLFKEILQRNTGWKVRHFGCTDYGDQFLRPHLHMGLFIDFQGKAPKPWTPKGENLKRLDEQRIRWRQYGSLDREIIRAWGCKGAIQSKLLTDEHAQYLAKYLVKGELTQKQLHPEQEPEQFSRTPGLGQLGGEWIAAEIRKIGGTLVELNDLDQHQWLCDASTFNWLPEHVPSNQNRGRRTTKKTYPVDKYLRGKIIQAMGGDERSDRQKAQEQRFKRDLKKVEHLGKRDQQQQKSLRQVRRKHATRGKT